MIISSLTPLRMCLRLLQELEYAEQAGEVWFRSDRLLRTSVSPCLLARKGSANGWSNVFVVKK